MKRIKKALAAIMLMTATLFIAGCKPEDDPNNGGNNHEQTNAPTVKTASVNDITTNSAKSGGVVTNDGGSSVTERGICWSSNQGPTINGDHVSCGSGTGVFAGEITDLLENTVYYVRAYATNSIGTSYGEERSFQTEETIPVYTIEVFADPWRFGEVVGGGEYQRGEQCTVTAVAHDGYSFVNWTENGNIVSLEENYTFTVTGDRSLIANFDHAYVDLGLPSGTLWATCNICATVPEDYGEYVAWGEIHSKNYYDWNTYRYANGDFDQLIKYCTLSSYGYHGFTDNLTVLEPSDDAVINYWGSGWRMPTIAEFQELFYNTTATWTTQNGVNGALFTASNGNSLFLPAAGYRREDELREVGSFGCYWSSTLHTNYPDKVYLYSYRFMGLHGFGFDSRNLGRPIRAVRSEPQK